MVLHRLQHTTGQSAIVPPHGGKLAAPEVWRLLVEVGAANGGAAQFVRVDLLVIPHVPLPLRHLPAVRALGLLAPIVGRLAV